MAVATDFQDLRANLEVTHYAFDPDATSAQDVKWIDMRDSSAIMMTFFRTVGSSNLTFKVLANAASDGSGTDVEVRGDQVSSQPDAVGDYVVTEVSASEIQQAAEAAGISGVRYVTANLTFATGTDEGVVTYIRKPKHAQLDLTADSIA